MNTPLSLSLSLCIYIYIYIYIYSSSQSYCDSYKILFNVSINFIIILYCVMYFFPSSSQNNTLCGPGYKVINYARITIA